MAQHRPRVAEQTPTPDATEKIDRFLATERPDLPCVVVDLDVVRAKYAALRALFPDATLYYAVKANPAASVLATLDLLGAKFDLASEGEIDRCRGLGIAAERFSFGNTIKRESEIARAYNNGVDRFAFDSIGELEKIARAAPGARVFCRMLVDAKGADWPLTRKFGCDRQMAADLLGHARAVGLRPIGVSFHVGSQQTDPAQWRSPSPPQQPSFTPVPISALTLSSSMLGVACRHIIARRSLGFRITPKLSMMRSATISAFRVLKSSSSPAVISSATPGCSAPRCC